MSYEDLGKVEYLPFGESVELMKNRQLDATLQSAGLGVSAIRDLATSIKIVVVPVPAEWSTRSATPLPGRHIPANTYEGQTTDVPPLPVPNYLVTIAACRTSGLPDDQDHVRQSRHAVRRPRGRQGDRARKRRKGMPVPLHPGAARFYKKKALIK